MSAIRCKRIPDAPHRAAKLEGFSLRTQKLILHPKLDRPGKLPHSFSMALAFKLNMAMHHCTMLQSPAAGSIGAHSKNQQVLLGAQN